MGSRIAGIRRIDLFDSGNPNRVGDMFKLRIRRYTFTNFM